jgi:hypothetical protein
LFDLLVIDRLSIALLLNKSQDGVHDLFLDMLEEILLPSHKVESVDIVDILLSFIHLAFNPMTVEVSEEVIVEFGSICVAFPFSDVEGEKGFVGMRLCILAHTAQMCTEILSKKLIELFSEKMCSTMALCQRAASLVTAGDCLLGGAKVVNGSVNAPVSSVSVILLASGP